jgi:hypothetical protein
MIRTFRIHDYRRDGHEEACTHTERNLLVGPLNIRVLTPNLGISVWWRYRQLFRWNYPRTW